MNTNTMQPTWIAVENTEATPAPAYGVLEIIGVSTSGLSVKVRRPTTADLPAARLLFLGATPLPSSGQGFAHANWPALVLHDSTAGTLALGGTLGTQANSYKLLGGNTGFRVLEATAAGQDLVVAAADGTTFDTSGGTIGGAVSDGEVAFGDGTDVIDGDPGFTVTRNSGVPYALNLRANSIQSSITVQAHGSGSWPLLTLYCSAGTYTSPITPSGARTDGAIYLGQIQTGGSVDPTATVTASRNSSGDKILTISNGGGGSVIAMTAGQITLTGVSVGNGDFLMYGSGGDLKQAGIGDGLQFTGTHIAVGADLIALDALTGTNTIYYRSGADTWSPVTIGTNLSFSGGTLNASGGSGTVTSVGITAPAAGITVSGSPVTTSGNMTLALADDLAALEALTGTDTIYRRSGTSTWSAVTYGPGMSFASGELKRTGVGACIYPGTANTTALPNATVTVLTLGSTVFDTHSMKSGNTLVIPTGMSGLWQVGVTWFSYFNTAANRAGTDFGTDCGVYVYVNSGIVRFFSGENSVYDTKSWTLYLAAGDVVDMRIYHAYGSSVNSWAYDPYETSLSVVFLGST